MKKLLLTVAACALLGTLGCKDKQLTTDAPPAVTKAPEPLRLAPPVSRVEPDEITEENYKDLAGELQKELTTDQRATARSGRTPTEPK